MISFYSFFVAVLYFNFCLLIVSTLRKRTSFVTKYSSSLLLFATGLGVARVLVPLDFQAAYVIQSFTVMPVLRDFFGMDIFHELTVGNMVLLLWVGGIARVLLIQYKNMVRDYKMIVRLKKVKNKKVEWVWANMKLPHAKLVVSPEVGTPMVFGCFTAHIFVPDIVLTKSEWEVVLSHEYQHFKNHDTWLKIFHLLLTAFFWWNPIVHRFNSELDNLLELRCDASMCQSMSVEEKQEYLRCILSVMTQMKRGMPTEWTTPTSALVSVDSEAFMIQRFQLVMNDQQKELRSRLMAFSLIVVTFLLSYLILFQPAGYPVGNEWEVGVRITPDNAYILIQED